MSDNPLPTQFSWVCPNCARRVPSRLEECRCGFVRESAAAAAPEEGAVPGIQMPPPEPSSGHSRWISWAVLGVVALVAAGTLVALQTIPVKPEPGPPGAAEAPADTASSAPAPAIPLPELGAGGAPAFSPYPVRPDFSPGSSEAAAPSPGPPALPAVSLEDVVSQSIPAIVSIETREGRGSGFFAAPRTVITNRHVVQDNVSVTVRLSSGQTLPGRVDASSAEYDLAVVRVDSASPTQAQLPLGSVENVRPGQEVIAIGLALGVFQNSVTRGIVSAVRRAERTVMLQTDAAINPGNSGGPLLNRQGEVIGINTLKISGTAESLGFAVAVDHARALLSGEHRAETPLSRSAPVSQPLAPAFSSRSQTDSARVEGTQRYEQIVELVARRAGQLDGYWNRIKANCTVRVAGGYDREWFGLWDGLTTLTSPDSSCSAAARDLEQLATEVRSAMTAAQEDARRASALPGQLREIRRRYRMDWTGWER